jgi:hypothetical protein
MGLVRCSGCPSDATRRRCRRQGPARGDWDAASERPGGCHAEFLGRSGRIRGDGECDAWLCPNHCITAAASPPPILGSMLRLRLRRSFDHATASPPPILRPCYGLASADPWSPLRLRLRRSFGHRFGFASADPLVTAAASPCAGWPIGRATPSQTPRWPSRPAPRRPSRDPRAQTRSAPATMPTRPGRGRPACRHTRSP